LNVDFLKINLYCKLYEIKNYGEKEADEKGPWEEDKGKDHVT